VLKGSELPFGSWSPVELVGDTEEELNVGSCSAAAANADTGTAAAAVVEPPAAPFDPPMAAALVLLLPAGSSASFSAAAATASRSASSFLWSAPAASTQSCGWRRLGFRWACERWAPREAFFASPHPSSLLPPPPLLRSNTLHINTTQPSLNNQSATRDGAPCLPLCFQSIPKHGAPAVQTRHSAAPIDPPWQVQTSSPRPPPCPRC